MLCSFRNDSLLHTEGFWVLSRHIWLACCEMHLLWFNLRICRLWEAHHFKQKSSVQIYLTRSDTLMKLWGGSSLPWHSLCKGLRQQVGIYLLYNFIKQFGKSKDKFGHMYQLVYLVEFKNCVWQYLWLSEKHKLTKALHATLVQAKAWRSAFEHLFKTPSFSFYIRLLVFFLCSQQISVEWVPLRRKCLKVALLYDDLRWNICTSLQLSCVYFKLPASQ